MTSEQDLAGKVEKLSRLLVMLREALELNNEEDILFDLANKTNLLIDYRLCVIWAEGGKRNGVQTVSGQTNIDQDAPFIRWINKVLKAQFRSNFKQDFRLLKRSEIKSELQADWGSWLPENGLIIPLYGEGQNIRGIAFFAREAEWKEKDIKLCQEVCKNYSLIWGKIATRRRSWGLPKSSSRRKVVLAIALGLFISSLIPVSQTILAPAEIIPKDPILIRSEVDGIIDTFYVEPNEKVSANQLILRLDPTDFKNALLIAENELRVSEAEHQQAAQMAINSSEARAKMPLLERQVATKQAEVELYRSRLARVEIRAPRDGIFVIGDLNIWIGRPVETGQRIATIANQNNIEIEILLPVRDAITLDLGTEVNMFLNIAPGSPLAASLTFASYQAEITAEGVLAFRLKAALNDNNNKPRIGLRGTAKLYGEKSPIIMHVLRRPLAAIRQWLGF